MAQRGNNNPPDLPHQSGHFHQTGDQSGHHQPPAPRRNTSPATRGGDQLETGEIVSVVAALIPGLGQLLLGQKVKGLVILGLSILLMGGFGLLSVASVVDAFLVAKAGKRREVGEWEFFPDFKETFGL